MVKTCTLVALAEVAWYTLIFTMKSMKDLKKNLHELHALHGELSSFVVPNRALFIIHHSKFPYHAVQGRCLIV